MTIRVLLVDDQPMLRTGFRLILETEPDLEVVGEAGDGHTAIAQARALQPDVVLMDIRMPRMDGLAATRQITQFSDSDGPPRVLILTTYDLDEYVVEALRAGASGFLLKDAAAESVVDAVRTVYHGDAVVAPSVTKRLLEQFARLLPAGRTADPSAADSLTERELHVLMLMARGLSNAEIAVELVLGESTVKSHVSSVLMKLGVRDRVQAVVFAYESRLVVPA